jgi:putative addiction module component (TIGR02574 family)
MASADWQILGGSNPFMSDQTQAVLQAALALSATERELLVQRLLESLPSTVDELNDEEFADELDRRWEEYQRDPSAGIPWSEIKRLESVTAATCYDFRGY